MPVISDVSIDSSAVVADNENFNVTVKAKVSFSANERNLELKCNARIALYEIDETMDVYSVFPNGGQIFLQRASRGDRDDFLGFSRNFTLNAQDGDTTIEHRFSVRSIIEPDTKMELKALVICVPETATAMKWSGTKSVQVVVT